MIEQVKLTKIYINDTKKSGEKLLTKDGRPYRKIAIQTNKHAGYLSDFIFRDDDPKLLWKVDDEVDIIVYQNGDFKNFKVPTQIDLLEARVKTLEELINTPDERAVKHTTMKEFESEEDDSFINEIPF